MSITNRRPYRVGRKHDPTSLGGGWPASAASILGAPLYISLSAARQGAMCISSGFSRLLGKSGSCTRKNDSCVWRCSQQMERTTWLNTCGCKVAFRGVQQTAYVTVLRSYA